MCNSAFFRLSAQELLAVTPEFARAYLGGRKRLREGALKFPVVRHADGTIVDCGSVYAWRKGVAARVLAGELFCNVVTFVRNPYYDPRDASSALFTEHTIESSIQGKAGWIAPESQKRHPLQAGESSAQGRRGSMEDETVLLMDLNTVLEADPHAHPRVSRHFSWHLQPTNHYICRPRNRPCRILRCMTAMEAGKLPITQPKIYTSTLQGAVHLPATLCKA